MVYNAREFARLRNGLLAISAIAWTVLLLEPDASLVCSAPGSPVPWSLLLATMPAASLARGWALMLAAMMLPMLAPAIDHIRLGSFVRRRPRAIACFLGGYSVVWMAVGAALLAVELALKRYAPPSSLPIIVAALAALVWQVSPAKQTCLNRCHRHRPFAAFGLAADWDLFRLGIEHGLWCAASCALLMLIPLLLPQGHFLAMLAIGVLLYCERLDPPEAPAWRWRGFGAAFRGLSQRWRGAGAVSTSPSISVQN